MTTPLVTRATCQRVRRAFGGDVGELKRLRGEDIAALCALAEACLDAEEQWRERHFTEYQKETLSAIRSHLSTSPERGTEP